MHAPYFLRPDCNETINITREESSGEILVRMRLEDVCVEAYDDLVDLLSCWWLRWIDVLDCEFFQDATTWQVNCRLPPNHCAMLTPVLSDLLSIKGSVCL